MTSGRPPAWPPGQPCQRAGRRRAYCGCRSSRRGIVTCAVAQVDDGRRPPGMPGARCRPAGRTRGPARALKRSITAGQRQLPRGHELGHSSRASAVSRRDDPKGRRSNSTSFSSRRAGAWSVTMQSMVPSRKPAMQGAAASAVVPQRRVASSNGRHRAPRRHPSPPDGGASRPAVNGYAARLGGANEVHAARGGHGSNVQPGSSNLGQQ